MVVGHPQEPLTFNTIDIALHKFRIYGASNSIPANLKECIDFSVKHGVKAHTTYYRSLDDIHAMIELLQTGNVRGRLAVQFA
jgi:propanol-preferring alcohol dehydrogenase